MKKTKRILLIRGGKIRNNMSKELKKLRVEVVGYEDQLNTIAVFLRKIEVLGNIGATRTLKLWVDGDGAARLKMIFPDMEEKIEIDANELSAGNTLEMYID